MADDVIRIKGQRYFLHGTYNNKRRAVEVANWGRRQGSRYFILTIDSWFSGQKMFRVYFNKIV